MDIAVGDWVRFQFQGRLVIGKVEYVTPHEKWDTGYDIVTVEYGPIRADRIFEFRRGIH
jgi:hypothetical protein